jgi:hypothetical protein
MQLKVNIQRQNPCIFNTHSNQSIAYALVLSPFVAVIQSGSRSGAAVVPTHSVKNACHPSIVCATKPVRTSGVHFDVKNHGAAPKLFSSSLFTSARVALRPASPPNASAVATASALIIAVAYSLTKGGIYVKSVYVSHDTLVRVGNLQPSYASPDLACLGSGLF